MKITVITLFPDMIKPFFDESIIGRAQKNGLIELEIVNLRDYGQGEHRVVDDRPYGGGAGMVLMAEPLVQAINKSKIENEKTKISEKVILTSAKGSVFNQPVAKKLSKLNHLIIVCGHYEGVDERVMSHIDAEISLGDFVMTGGEIASCAIIDSIVRLIPGVLKKSEATQEESFFSVPTSELVRLFPNDSYLKELHSKNVEQVTLVEYPHYTRPQVLEGKAVPKQLMSGNHKEIRDWRISQAYLQTKKKRPDLLSVEKDD